MENINITLLSNGHLKLTVSDYFCNPKHIELPYKNGLYGVLPDESPRGPYNDPKPHKNWMEWAYNNPYLPYTEINYDKGINLPFLDGSHANAMRVLGSLKEAWKSFKRDCRINDQEYNDIDINLLENMFFGYYIGNGSGRISNAAAILWNYVYDRRRLITDEERQLEYTSTPFTSEQMWKDGSYDFIRHLIFITPKGYMMEIILLSLFKKLTNASQIIESTAADERNGVDGFLEYPNGDKIPISLKPATYYKASMSPLNTTCWVTYRRSGNDLIYEIQNGTSLIQSKLTKKAA